MADLATLAEFKAHLGDDAGSLPADAVLTVLLDSTETLFEGECSRTHRPFVAAQTARVETRNGTGSSVLWLHYGVSAATEILLGYDTSDPDETLDVADTDVIIIQSNGCLTRVDGGRWGCLDQPSYIRVTYDAAADLPADAKLAVLDVATAIYRRRGSEGLTAESAGPYSADFAEAMRSSGVWQSAVAHHRVPFT